MVMHTSHRIVATLILSFIFFFSIVPLYAQTPTTKSTITPKKSTPTPSPTPIRPPEQPTTGISLTVSPIFINLITDPGIPVSSQFKVRNNSNVTEYLKVGILKFVAQDGVALALDDIDETDEFPKWVTFSEKEFILDSNLEKTIKVTLSPPKDAALGYYYAFTISRIEDKSGAGEVVLSGIPAVPILMEVRSPLAKRELQMVDFRTDKPIYEYLPTEFQVTVKNTGNVHSIPFGDIFVDSSNTEDIAILPINPKRGNIIPQANRTYSVVWDDSMAVTVPKKEGDRVVEDKNGKPVFTTKWDFSKADKFRFGKYTARMLLVYDNGQRDIPIEATVSFWVIPWKILLAALIIGFLTLMGLKNIIFSYAQAIAKIWKGPDKKR